MLMKLLRRKKTYVKLLSSLYDFNLFYILTDSTEIENEMHFYDTYVDNIQTIEDVINVLKSLVKWNNGNEIKIIIGGFIIPIDNMDILEIETIKKTLAYIGICKLEDVYMQFEED